MIQTYTTGLNSTQLTQVARWGKLDPRSDILARLSGSPTNLIAITLFNLDIETIKKILIFQTEGLMFFLYSFTLYDFSRLLPTILLFKRSCYECAGLSISNLMIDSQAGQVEGLFSLPAMPFFHD